MNFDYRLAVFHGTRAAPTTTLGIRTCGLVACKNETVDSCGMRSSALLPLTFTSVSITGQFKTDPRILDLPITLQTDLRPLKDYTFCSEPRENEIKINVETLAETNTILSFGFYGRVFFNDGKELGRLEVDYGSESSTTVVAIVIVIVLLLVAAVVGFILYKRKVKYSAVSK